MNIYFLLKNVQSFEIDDVLLGCKANIRSSMIFIVLFCEKPVLIRELYRYCWRTIFCLFYPLISLLTCSIFRGKKSKQSQRMTSACSSEHKKYCIGSVNVENWRLVRVECSLATYRWRHTCSIVIVEIAGRTVPKNKNNGLESEKQNVKRVSCVWETLKRNKTQKTTCVFVAK